MTTSNHKRVIAVDLDGTLAEYHGWKGPDKIGAPIPAMVEKVKAAIAHGDQVYIFTARANSGSEWEHALSATMAIVAIAEWCKKNLGQVLPITDVKSFSFIEIWDDRAKQVIPNTGEFLEDHIQELAGAMK